MARIVRAYVTWPGPEHDVLRVVAEPTPDDWLPEAISSDVTLFREPDEHDEPTGPVVGIEIIDFLRFDEWDMVPETHALWQLRGEKPLPLGELLKRKQQALRERVALKKAG